MRCRTLRIESSADKLHVTVSFDSLDRIQTSWASLKLSHGMQMQLGVQLGAFALTTRRVG
jgi:hypothetical protein